MRTLTQIESSLDESISTAISNPSGSTFAEWRLWKTIFARAIWLFEGIMDLFKAEIENKVQTKQPGTLSWYYDRVMEFQGGADALGVFQGDTLVVNNGIPQYAAANASRRIIKQASLRAVNGALVIKLAKAQDEDDYQPLDDAEQMAFGLYLDNIKYPGTTTNVISMVSDLIKYDLEIIYDPIYTVNSVTTAVQAKLTEYRASMGFDDRVFPAKLVDKIMEAEGVMAVKKNSIQGYHATVYEWTNIDVMYTLVSGYFNYDAASELTFTNYKTL